MERAAGESWIIRTPSGEPLATRAQVARTLPTRMVGLLGRRALSDGEGLVIMACRSIHTAFMRFAIDAVFVDAAWRVVRVWEALGPWRVTPVVWGATAVIELPAGTLRRRLGVGDQLRWEAAGSA